VKKKVLFEDTVSYYNKWVQGMASREFAAQRMKFKDLFSTNHDLVTQSPNDAKADKVLPYPLPNSVAVLGDVLTGTTNAIKMFGDALRNPLVKDDEKAVKEIETIVECLNKSLAELNKIFITLSKNA